MFLFWPTELTGKIKEGRRQVHRSDRILSRGLQRPCQYSRSFQTDTIKETNNLFAIQPVFHVTWSKQLPPTQSSRSGHVTNQHRSHRKCYDLLAALGVIKKRILPRISCPAIQLRQYLDSKSDQPLCLSNNNNFMRDGLSTGDYKLIISCLSNFFPFYRSQLNITNFTVQTKYRKRKFIQKKFMQVFPVALCRFSLREMLILRTQEFLSSHRSLQITDLISYPTNYLQELLERF